MGTARHEGKRTSGARTTASAIIGMPMLWQKRFAGCWWLREYSAIQSFQLRGLMRAMACCSVLLLGAANRRRRHSASLLNFVQERTGGAVEGERRRDFRLAQAPNQ